MVLGRSIKIYQHIAAKHEVDVGNGRVSEQVAAPEDHHAADVARHPQQALAGKVFGLDLGAHAAQGFRRILRPARGIEGALIVVSGVNLDFVIFHARAQQLAQQDRHGIWLLAGGAAGAPYPE